VHRSEIILFSTLSPLRNKRLNKNRKQKSGILAWIKLLEEYINFLAIPLKGNFCQIYALVRNDGRKRTEFLANVRVEEMEFEQFGSVEH
jgi:hypothetical protein